MNEVETTNFVEEHYHESYMQFLEDCERLLMFGDPTKTFNLTLDRTFLMEETVLERIERILSEI